MAFRHGKATTFTLNGQALTAFCESIDFNIDVDTADTAAFGATFKSAIAGLPGGKLSCSGLYDPTATTGPAAVIWGCITGGVPVTGAYCPGGAAGAAGDWTFTNGLLVTSYSESSPVGGMVTFKADMLVVALPSRHA